VRPEPSPNREHRLSAQYRDDLLPTHFLLRARWREYIDPFELPMRPTTFIACLAAVACLLTGCYAGELGPAVLDIDFIETTIDNRLQSPIIVLRNGEPIDTLPARSRLTYPLGRRGLFVHEWKVVRPRSPQGDTIGAELTGSMGAQINATESYTIAAISGGDTRWFGPMIDNRSIDSIEVHMRRVPGETAFRMFRLPPMAMLDRAHLPYYHWNDSVAVLLINPGRRDTLRFTTADSGSRRLAFDPAVGGSGVTSDLIYRIQ